jgi:Na+-translocating ferredoxin:NAD+ oxidoreductase RnfG subunit
MNKASQYLWFKLISAGAIVGVFTGIGVAMVSLVYQATAQRIVDSQGKATR